MPSAREYIHLLSASAQAFDTHSGDAIFVFVVTARWRHWYKQEAYVAPL